MVQRPFIATDFTDLNRLHQAYSWVTEPSRQHICVSKSVRSARSVANKLRISKPRFWGTKALTDLRTSVDHLLENVQGKVIRCIEDHQHFGNAEVVVALADLNIRFISDRGDVWCELLIPGQPAQWHSLEDVMNALSIAVPARQTDLIPAMKQWIEYIHCHADDIRRTFPKK